MTTSARYLESAKIEQLASQYRREGFEVTIEPSGPDKGYDLVATIKGRRIAIEVKANSELASSADQIKKLRRKAFDQGFDEFRLVVVSPPHETQVQVDGLEQELAAYINANLPKALSELSRDLTVKSSKEIEIDSISVLHCYTRVAGRGVISVEIRFTRGLEGSSDASITANTADENSDSVEPGYAAGSPILNAGEDAWVGWDVDLPFSFDVELDRNLQVARAHSIVVDTSSLFD